MRILRKSAVSGSGRNVFVASALFCASAVSCAAAETPPISGDWADAQGATYTALKSIQNTGGQWIVSDIVPTCTDIVRTKFKSCSTTGNRTVWCARNSSNQNTFTGFALPAYFRLDRNATSSPTKSDGQNPNTDDCYVWANYNTLAYSVAGTAKTMVAASAGDYTVGSVLMFFASNGSRKTISASMTSSDIGNNEALAIYYFQLLDSTGALKHNLMPAERDSDGKAGFFDTVTSKFYAQSSNSSGDMVKTARTPGQGRKWTGLGGDGLMSNPANWEGNTLPASGEDLDFSLVPAFTAITADLGGNFGVYCPDVALPTFTYSSPSGRLMVKGGKADFDGDFNTIDGGLALDGGSAWASGIVRIADEAGKSSAVDVANGRLANGANFAVGQNGTGTMTVGADGEVASGSNLFVGNNSGGNGTLTVNGGSVSVSNGVLYVGGAASSTGAVTVNGGSVAVNQLIVASRGSGTLTINGGAVTVIKTDSNLNLAEYSGSSGTINLNGGVLETRRIYKGSGSGTIWFNGGTLRQNAVNTLTGGLIPGGNTVRVGPGGGTIDINGHNSAIGVALGASGDTGGLNFVGGNGTTITVGNVGVNYSGLTSIAPGTTLSVGQFAASNNILNNGLVVSGVPEVGQTILICTRGAGYNFENASSAWQSGKRPVCPIAPETEFEVVDASNIVVKTVGAVLPGWYIGPADGDLSDAANWSDGAVPGPGTNAVINCSACATLTKGATFAPSSITFAEGSAPITINGDDFTGIVAVTNLSSISHIINAKVYFAGDIQVSQPALGGTDDLKKPHVTFAGGAYAAEGCALENNPNSNAVYSRIVFGEYFLANDAAHPWAGSSSNNNRRNCVADNSTLHIPCAGNLGTIYVGTNAKFDVGAWTVNNDRLSFRNYGEIVVENLAVVGDGDVYSTHGQDGASVFRFGTVTNSITASNRRLRLGDANVAGNCHTFFIGAGGLQFTDGAAGQYIIGSDNASNYETVRPWNADFTIAGKGSDTALYMLGNVEFNTDDESGAGRTVTIDAKTITRTKTALTVSGSGALKLNNTVWNDETNEGHGYMTVTLKDTATFELASGIDFAADSVTLGGGTTFAFVNAGSTLALPAPISLPASGKATLRIDGEQTLKSGSHVLLDSVPEDYAEHLAVTGTAIDLRRTTLKDDGENVFLHVRSKGTIVIVR